MGELGPFTYKPGRDPFQSYFDVTTEAPIITKLEPLQKHELSALKVIAIVTGTVQPAAMILDPGGKPWLVRRGTLIGPPRGRVSQILSDRVVVEREYKDRLERVHKLRHQLRIRPDEEERDIEPPPPDTEPEQDQGEAKP
jgi:Tfp pilus assembly protein PilP